MLVPDALWLDSVILLDTKVYQEKPRRFILQSLMTQTNRHREEEMWMSMYPPLGGND
ncbi:hypothetical protein [Nostoc edaphicum]|uniref:hypothetical protein n=1 Tax=Nostoc edaphicum TaxID=264686 RepID=UPI001EEA540A|nr:hypothetical protein [Nostoc edaphicum]